MKYSLQNINIRVTLALLVLILLCGVNLGRASEQGNVQDVFLQQNQHVDTQYDQDTAQIKHDIGKSLTENTSIGDVSSIRHTSAPTVYYLGWGILGFAFVIACFRCLWIHKHGKLKHNDLGIAGFLVILIIVLYVMGQFPEVQRHFDPASHQFVDGYHEAPGIGFIKFIYKVGLGVCLMIYAIMGREEH